MQLFPHHFLLLVKSCQALAGLCAVEYAFCNQLIAELLFYQFLSQASFFFCICLHFLTHAFLLPQLDAVTNFHACESSVSQHSVFQVIQNNNSLLDFLENAVPKGASLGV